MRYSAGTVGGSGIPQTVYLYGRKVTVRTDHAALRWLLNFNNPEGQLARWLEVISEYDMTIQHKPGRKHGNADGLSRKACKQCGNDTDIGKVPEALEVSDGTEVSVQPGVIEVPEKVVAEVLVRGILAEPHYAYGNDQGSATK